MLDLYSHPDYGEKKLGLEYVIGREKITIAAFYKLGISFHAPGSVIVNLDTFQHLTGKSPVIQPSLMPNPQSDISRHF